MEKIVPKTKIFVTSLPNFLPKHVILTFIGRRALFPCTANIILMTSLEIDFPLIYHWPFEVLFGGLYIIQPFMYYLAVYVLFGCLCMIKPFIYYLVAFVLFGSLSIMQPLMYYPTVSVCFLCIVLLFMYDSAVMY